MSEKEKTIDSFKRYIRHQESTLDDYYRMDDEFYKDQIEELELSIKLLKKILNVIENQQQELQLKDKVIDEMAILIRNWDAFNNLGNTKDIKQYFINKVKGE